ncbi:MAG TPA: hypothetical protein VJ925_00880 [Longimicrobiales bacterium]|nr:hypothetical protein [Longimicrobiales bacterium]
MVDTSDEMISRIDQRHRDRGLRHVLDRDEGGPLRSRPIILTLPRATSQPLVGSNAVSMKTPGRRMVAVIELARSRSSTMRLYPKNPVDSADVGIDTKVKLRAPDGRSRGPVRPSRR